MPQFQSTTMPQAPPGALVTKLRRSELVARGERLLVGFSGGPDSTALLIALHDEDHDIVAAHFDHALQPASGLVAEHARRVCAMLGVRLLVERRDTPMPKGSVQAGARTLRYQFLERAAVEAKARKIVLAHTADDVVEGAVLHLLRGSGIAGLRGMPARRGRIVRPLLDVWRSEILAFLAGRGVTALDDPANADRVYARVRVRHELLPALERDRPGILSRLHAAAGRAATLQELIEQRAAAAVGGGVASRAVIAALPEPVAAEAVRLLYAMAGGRQPALSRAQLAAILRICSGARGGQGLDLPGGLRFRVVGGRAEVVPHAATPIDATLEVIACSGCDDPAAAHLRHGLQLRLGHRYPGLRMRPSGGVGTRKLQDIFVDACIPREERDGWPLVFAGDRLAWVPGVAVDRDLMSGPGEAALHVTVTRILSNRDREIAMLESPDSPRGEPS